MRPLADMKWLYMWLRPHASVALMRQSSTPHAGSGQCARPQSAFSCAVAFLCTPLTCLTSFTAVPQGSLQMAQLKRPACTARPLRAAAPLAALIRE